MDKNRAMILLAALAFSAVSLPALAADGKGYPGSFCEAGAPSGRSGFSLGGGGIFNLTSGALLVSCPAVKDLSRLKDAQVRYIDPNPSADVSCTLRTLRNDQTQSGTQIVASTGFASTVRQLNFNGQSAVTGGFYTLDCSLPPLSGSSPSGIVMYQINEE
jgi:hypothetical protein